MEKTPPTVDRSGSPRDEDTQIRWLARGTESMRQGFSQASDVQDTSEMKELESRLVAVISDLRRAVLSRLEESLVGDGLASFEQHRTAVEQSEWHGKIYKGESVQKHVGGAMDKLRQAILVRKGLMRRQADHDEIVCATEDVIAQMRTVADEAEKVRLGGDQDGEYGHRLLYLLQDVAMQELNVLQNDCRKHPGVQPMVDVLFGYTNEAGLK